MSWYPVYLKATTEYTNLRSSEYQLQSSSGTSETYIVTLVAGECKLRPSCVPQCTMPECQYLCRHTYKCTCYDYQHGHLCKHVHKVHAFRNGSVMNNINNARKTTTSEPLYREASNVAG